MDMGNVRQLRQLAFLLFFFDFPKFVKCFVSNFYDYAM